MAANDGMAGDGAMRPSDRPSASEIDIWSLIATIWRRRNLVVVMTILAVGGAAFYLVTTTPRYTSQAKILIENRESQFTRTEPVAQDQSFMSDQAAVQSQVQVLLSRDLAGRVSETLDLTEVREFNSQSGNGSIVRRLLTSTGLSSRAPDAVTAQRINNLYFDRLAVYQVGTSRVIAVEFSSADAQLASQVVNTLSDEYIALQRTTKFDSNQDAITWLGSQIEDLRGKVAEAEAAVESFRAESGIYAANDETSLGQQQLAELNSELIRASAARSEAEAKAKLIDRLLKKKGGIEEAADVLNSQLIQRLREQQAAVSRQHAELTAALLPAHPRMRQLTAELRDLERRIADEAGKIARGLENAAQVAGARERAIRDNLSLLKQAAGDVSHSEVKLRALEREAAAQRETLESFLRKFREASARQDVDSQPANARIISRGTVATNPSYPPKGPILALASIAGVLLGFVAVFFTEMVSRALGAANQTTASTDRASEQRSDPERVDPSLLARAGVVASEPAPAMPEVAVPADAPGLSAVRQIARRLLQWRTSRGLRKVAVMQLAEQGATDSGFGEELGVALSSESATCVLVDARPGFGPGAHGLRDVLKGQAALGQAVQPAGSDGLARLAAGSGSDDDDTVLSGDRPKLVMDALSGSFDLVIVDAGASDGTKAPLVMARTCDLVLLVVPADSLSGAEVKQTIARLRTDGITHAAVVSRGPAGYTLYDAVSVRPIAAEAA